MSRAHSQSGPRRGFPILISSVVCARISASSTITSGLGCEAARRFAPHCPRPSIYPADSLFSPNFLDRSEAANYKDGNSTGDSESH
jgi:hypothetical protein